MTPGIHRDPSDVSVEVNFIAPVPVGNEVAVYFVETKGVLGGWEETCAFVIDSVTGILFADASLPEHLDPAHPVVEDYSNRHRASLARDTLVGRVTSCVVITRGEREYNHLRTKLTIRPNDEPDQPYR